MAHSSNVSSLVLGKSSGRLLATGGDDCRVNIWSVNKPNCIMVRSGALLCADDGRDDALVLPPPHPILCVVHKGEEKCA